jgi:hypothetical protein
MEFSLKVYNPQWSYTSGDEEGECVYEAEVLRVANEVMIELKDFIVRSHSSFLVANHHCAIGSTLHSR